MKRVAPLLPLLVVALFAFAGCDSSDPVPRTEAFSFGLTLYFEDMQQSAFVASQAFEPVDIPPSVVRDGAVMAYFWDQGTWTALPFTLGLEKADEPVVDFTVTFGYAFRTEMLELFFEASSSDSVVWDDIAEIFGSEYYPDGIDIKVVVIDSYVAASQDVDLTDYQAVKQHFNLAGE